MRLPPSRPQQEFGREPVPRILTPADIADFRSRLCDIAAGLFAEKGEAGFNMRELAKRLGVSAMTPYRYFKDKDAILAEVRARAFGRLADCLEAALAAGPDAMGFARAYIRFVREEQTQYRLMYDLGQGSEQPPASKDERRARGMFSVLMWGLRARDGLAGEPEQAALLFWCALHGLGALYLAGKISDQDLNLILSQTVANLGAHGGNGPATSEGAPFEPAGKSWWPAGPGFEALAAGE